jgi:methionyl aminopeptidase
VYPLSPRRPVPKSIKHPDWAVTGIPKRENRLSQSKWDLLDATGQEAMRKVCRLAREVLDITAAAMKPGVTTDYLDEICHNACVEREVSDVHYSTIPSDSLRPEAVISISTQLQPFPEVIMYIA